jgi:hypothetical protein
MVYDAATSNVMLFGGVTNFGLPLNDTWTWNGTTWIKLAPAKSPPTWADASLACDAAASNAVLFGGVNSQIGSYNDTWTWG